MDETKRNKLVKFTTVYDILNAVLGLFYILLNILYLGRYIFIIVKEQLNPGSNIGFGWEWMFMTFGLFLVVPMLAVPICRWIGVFTAKKNRIISSICRIVQIPFSFLAGQLVSFGTGVLIVYGIGQLVVGLGGNSSFLYNTQVRGDSLDYVIIMGFSGIVFFVFIIKEAFEIVLSVLNLKDSKKKP